MKFTKYIMIALVIVVATKRFQFADQPQVESSQTSGNLEPLVFADKVVQLRKYDQKTKTATMSDGSVFVAVIEQSQATTPPNLTVPSMKLFATIKNKSSKSELNQYGGQSSHTNLWGISVMGDKLPIKSPGSSKTIGYLWQDSKIAQLSNGTTMVAVLAEPQGNYKAHSAYELGPIWTRFSQHQLVSISKAYGILPSAENMKTDSFGLVKIEGQKRQLHGINLQEATSRSHHEGAAVTDGHMKPEKIATMLTAGIHKNGITPGADKLPKTLKMSAAQALTALYGVKTR